MCEIDSLSDVLKFKTRYNGFIFDLDDTLYAEKDYVKSGYKKIADTFADSEIVYNMLWNFFLEEKNAIDEMLKQKKQYSEENKVKYLKIYREQIPDIQMYPEAKNVLSILIREGKKIGIITDGRVEGQKAKIQALGLQRIIQDIIITDALGGIQFRKPNEYAFVLMKERWQLPFFDMVYIGDNIKKDFIAPKQLGMGTVWFHNKDGLYQ